MGILLDIVFLLIIFISVLLSIKKGFVRSLVGVVGYILAVVLAFSFSTLVSEYIYDSFLNQPVVSSIEAAILENNKDVVENLPGFIKMLIPSNADLNSVLSSSSVNVSTISEQVNVTVRPLAVSVIKVFATFVIFVVCLIISRLLAKLLDCLFKGAVLGTANKLLGGALGAVKGVVVGSLFSLVVYLSTVLPSSNFLDFTRDALNNSFICKSVVDFILCNF